MRATRIATKNSVSSCSLGRQLHGIWERDLEIIPARVEHASFIAWSRLTADRAHRPRGIFEFYIDGTEAETLAFLEAASGSEMPSPGQYRNFFIIEEGGTLLAALCGFFPRDYDPARTAAHISEVSQRLGRTPAQHTAGRKAIDVWDLVHLDAHDDTWIIAWVATGPEYRRRGLCDSLLTKIMAVGRARGATVADVGVYIGNDAAQRAYEKAGFAVVLEKRHPDFERVFGAPGVRLLRRSL